MGSAPGLLLVDAIVGFFYVRCEYQRTDCEDAGGDEDDANESLF